MNALNNPRLLTDEMERRLLQQEINAQFRPRPMRAVRKTLQKFVNALAAVYQHMADARLRSIQTQVL